MQKVVVIVNSGDRVIPRPLLQKLIEAADADTWECIDLPTASRMNADEIINDLNEATSVIKECAEQLAHCLGDENKTVKLARTWLSKIAE